MTKVRMGEELKLGASPAWKLSVTKVPPAGERHRCLPWLSQCMYKSSSQMRSGRMKMYSRPFLRWVEKRQKRWLPVKREMDCRQETSVLPGWLRGHCHQSFSPGWWLQSSETTIKHFWAPSSSRLSYLIYCIRTFSPEDLTLSLEIKPKLNEVVSGNNKLHFERLKMRISWCTLNLPSSPVCSSSCYWFLNILPVSQT